MHDSVEVFDEIFHEDEERLHIDLSTLRPYTFNRTEDGVGRTMWRAVYVTDWSYGDEA